MSEDLFSVGLPSRHRSTESDGPTSRISEDPDKRLAHIMDWHNVGPVRAGKYNIVEGLREDNTWGTIATDESLSLFEAMDAPSDDDGYIDYP